MRLMYLLLAAMVLMPGLPIWGQDSPDTVQSSKPKLYVVGTAHLDTQWRWTIKTSIDELIPDTFRKNIALMEQYPDYVFSFEGAFRYMLMDEYYHDEFELVRPFIKSGQWRVTGSWVDAVDVNLPSFESLVRHTLYGNGYFKKEFGKRSRDIFLPDCFGFGYALPSIAAHCGLESISTQKLTWGGCIGVPFDIGIWKGVDGSQIKAGLNPGSYGATFDADLSRDTTWLAVARKQGDSTGLYAAYRYFGTGDVGGSPEPASVDWLHKSMHSDGPLEVHSVGADDLVDLAASADTARLPHHDGELVMTRHGVGCYTSQAAMKRWNRRNELLADAAERASVMAHGFGSLDYPREMLRDAWIRFLWHQFHDDITGTSIPEAYEYSWNDELLCQNRFAAMLEHAVESAAPLLDTRARGVPLVVYNPIAIEREDVVEAAVSFDKKTPRFVRVFDPSGKEVPADVDGESEDGLHIRFLAEVPSTGYAVYDVRPAKAPSSLASELKVTERTLENSRYLVTVNDAGDVASIYDKPTERELLSAPIQFEFLTDTPKRWPAWEIDFDDIMAPPLNLWIGSPKIGIVEDGLARVALQIERHTDASTVRTTIRLASGGASDRVEFYNEIDWYEREMMLKACIPVTSANDSVWYDLGLGAIRRGLNHEKLYEVPGHQWAAIPSPDAPYGVAVLNDCRYGWDHPTADKLRLTLIHTPGVADGWEWVGDERSQDNGHHVVTFAVQGHAGDWHHNAAAWQAARLNQPLMAFETAEHKGKLGKTYSFVSVAVGDGSTDASAEAAAHPAVMVNAVKLAEDSDEIVVRLRELDGRSHDRVALTFDRAVKTAREINGSEEAMGDATVEKGRLLCSLTPYQPKAFAVTLESPDVSVNRPVTVCLDLPFNIDGISLDSDRCDGDFDGHGCSLAGELIPDTLTYCDVPFVFGSATAGSLNVVKCEGQTIPLPDGRHDRLQILVASVDGPATASFVLGKQQYDVTVQDYADHIGQWNNRLSDGELHDQPNEIAPAYINRVPVAWYGSHRHTSECENDAYQFTYLFLVELDVHRGANTLTLPSDDRVRVMAATLVDKPYPGIAATRPLFDETRTTFARITADSTSFAGQSTISMSSPVPNTDIYYTLDGTDPDMGSTPYTGPITVASTTTIKACGVKHGVSSSHVASKTVSRLSLRDAVEVGDVEPGLFGRYYEENWSSLPNFDSAQIVAGFVADTVAVPDMAREEYFGLTFHGYVRVPRDGVYAFSTNSDDGSCLKIGDTLLVNNDGLHGDSEMTGLIALKAGYHPITIEMFQCEGGVALGASIAGPDLPKQKIPADMLYHIKPEAQE